MNFEKLFSFLSELSENNNKEWFDEHRYEYEAIKKDINLLVSQLIQSIGSFDKDILELEPKNCVFRINRDVRFSKDKSPYKTNLGAYLSKGGKKSIFGGYYLHLEPNGCFLASGIWMPMPPQLNAIRQEIDYRFSDFDKIISKGDLKKYFSNDMSAKTATMPKGYDKENPAAEYLKFKSFVLVKKIENKELLEVNYLEPISNQFKEFKPFIDFLNQAIEGT